jgi:hypothetical protein
LIGKIQDIFIFGIWQVQEAADCLGADCAPRYVEIKQMQELGDMSWGALMVIVIK